jgi:hypothetical protein
MDKDKLTKIAQDKEFIQKLLNQRTDEDFKNTLEEKDINVSLEDAKEIRAKLTAALNGEINLTEEELEAIGGGTSVGGEIKHIFNTSVALALFGGVCKVVYDVYDDVSTRKTLSGMAASITHGLGCSGPYKRGIHMIGDAVEESEKIVKGFGLESGKLF